MAPDSAQPAPVPLSLEAYRLLFELNPHPIFLFERAPAWRIRAVNDAALRLYGWSREEFLRMTMLDIRPESEREVFRVTAAQAPATVAHVGTHLHQRRDGRRMTVDVTTAAVTLDDGTSARIAVITDVTEDIALREAQDRLAAIVAGSYDAIILTDLRGRIQSWNPSAERIFGYTEDEARGRSIALIHPPGQGPTFRDMAAEVIAGRGVRAFDTAGVRKDGRELVLSMTLSPTYSASGEVVGISGIERDVTERHEAERTLRESQARFARIFRSDLILTAVVDVPAQRFTDVNETWLKFFGLRREELIGLAVDGFSDLWLDAHQGEALTSAWRAGAPIRSVEVGFRTRAGARYGLLSVHHSPQANEDIVMMVDITERRRLETQLSEARRLESLGRLAGGVAHDFNNMLSVMSGYAELLAEQLPAASPALADLQEIQRAADRATDLTRQLLAFGRRQMLQPRRVDLNEVVTHAETFLRRVLGERVTMQLALAEAPLWVDADASQLEQVLLNLASNARDALDGAGVVEITTKARTLPRAWAEERGLRPGRAAELGVRDSGRGMDAETLQRIFEPFFTTKEVGAGTGLGLATVYGIVKQSGGHIDAASTPGQGSLFRVILPLAAMPEPARQRLEPEGAAESGTETILIVEDEPAVAALAASQLQRLGYSVLTAHSAAEAAALTAAHDGEIHLVLTDVVMPGASGRELVESLRASRPAIKVLYMSGYAADEVVRYGVEDGKTPFLEKPFTLGALARKVRETLD